MQHSRRSWLIFAPFVALVALGAGWSAFWYFAARNAEAFIGAWIEQEASLGRVYRCASRTVGGFPFRIEVRCSDPVMELNTMQPPRTVKAKDLVGLAQVYQPNLVIAEIAGPVSIAESGSPASLQAEWRLAQASLAGRRRSPERLSVVLESVRLDQVEGSATETLGSADHLELHLRRSPGPAQDKPAVDFAVLVTGAVASRGPLSGRPVDLDTTGLLRGLTDLQPKPFAARLREWQMAGGRLELTKLRIRQGEAVAVAAGDIGLSAAGRPDGAFNITMTGFDRLVRELAGGGGGLQLGVLAGLAFLGRPAEIDGRRAVSLPLRFNDGAAYLGPIPLGKVDPLY
jgi:hypothetical protein